MPTIALDTVAVISERWPVHPFNGVFDDPRFNGLPIMYSVSFDHNRYGISEYQNLTVVCLKHSFIWNGTEDEFQQWGRRKGGPEIALYISDVVNRLIDLVHGTFEESSTNPFPHIRHVGIRDFVALDSLCGPHRQNLISYAMPASDARFARMSEGIVSKVNFSVEDDPPLEKIKLLRAVELLNSGYRTESILIGFGILDNYIQKTLISLLSDRKIDKPDKLLREIKENRLKIYLGPVLKMLTGHSLKEDDNHLWEKLKTLNRDRNEAIHQSVDVAWDKAASSLETVRSIIVYLETFKRADLTENEIPVGVIFGVESLPILLDMI